MTTPKKPKAPADATKAPRGTFCSFQIFDQGMVGHHYRQCGSGGKVLRSGKWYCGVHDPERIKMRAAKRDAFFSAREREADARAKVREAERAIISIARQIDVDDRTERVSMALASAVGSLLHAESAHLAARDALEILAGVGKHIRNTRD